MSNYNNETKILNLKVYSCVEVPMPLNKENKRRFEIMLQAKEILERLNGWTDINPREATLTSTKAPIKEMKKTIDEIPKLFEVCNRGLTITAQKIEYKAFDKVAELTLTNKTLHGLLDGGHTYLLLCALNKNGIDLTDVYIAVQVLIGFDDLEEAVLVAGGRNTSTQVKENSLQNAKDYYEPIKQILSDMPYADDISYKETEFKLDTNGNRVKLKEIRIVDILVKFLCFYTEEFVDENHNPNKFYNSNKKCYDYISNKYLRESVYKYIKLLPKILELYDVIYDKMPGMYNTARHIGLLTEDDTQTFGRIPCIETDKSVTLHVLNKKSEYEIPTSLIYPILAAHRLLINKDKDGNYYWEYDPIKFFEQYGYNMVVTVCREAKETDSISSIAKKSGIWKNTYLDAKLSYIEMCNNKLQHII